MIFKYSMDLLEKRDIDYIINNFTIQDGNHIMGKCLLEAFNSKCSNTSLYVEFSNKGLNRVMVGCGLALYEKGYEHKTIMLFVKEEYRNMGYGTKLVNKIVDYEKNVVGIADTKERLNFYLRFDNDSVRILNKI